ncbi:TPA: phage GP46 family protein [Klebsiella variicola]|nr:phage GP46 family protein [Klebsiella variicola]
MTDLAFVWINGRGDIAQNGTDMLTDDSLTSDVIISLFTDRRALDSDEIPGGDTDRRGWWGDSFRTRPIGSRLWLLSREKTLQSVLDRAAEYALEALLWMKEAQCVKKISVASSHPVAGWLQLDIELTLPDGVVTPYTFKSQYNGI